MWYIHTKENYSGIKNEIPFSATRRELEILILSEGSQENKYK